jgi:hypothetical protein
VEEIQAVLAKYDEGYLRDGLVSGEPLERFATRFYADSAEIYDAITRIRNVERNPQDSH